MRFIIYDLTLLALFIILISIFLYVKRKNLKKEGLLFLYKTKWGMKVIDNVGKKYKKTLKFLSYVSISVGYLLMGGMLYLFGKIVYLYIAYPNVVRAIKVPPIMPLIPYLPQAFKLNFLPPFYFIYWILILAIIAITHEFAHGIFMRRYNIKIKSTGFGFFPFFLPVFLAAFVEQDEKSMNKASRFKQMAVLSAGTFANVITAIFFFVIMILFFSLAFSPSGVTFDSYAYTAVSVAGISMVNGVSLDNPNYNSIMSNLNEIGFSKIETGNGNYLLDKEFLGRQENVEEYILAYLDAPAINIGLDGIIAEINGVPIESLEKLSEELYKYSPDEKITLSINDGEDVYNLDVVLDEHPEDSNKPWLGIIFNDNSRKGVFGKIVDSISSFKKPHVSYESNFGAAEFIYNFLWWIVLISFSVALVNMLPMGIFDGGKFFYLTILGLTKSKKKAERWFKRSTRFLLFLLVVLMVFWAWSFF